MPLASSGKSRGAKIPGMSTTPEPAPSPPCLEKAVDVALGEFNALRAEIVSRRSTQAATVGVGLTAVGVVFGLAFAPQGGDRARLLAVPPLALVTALLFLSETFVIHNLGRHIRDRVWPYLSDQTGYEPSWEKDGAQATEGLKGTAAIVLFSAPAPMLFTALGFAALWLSDAEPLIVRWEGVLLGLTVIAAIGVIAIYKRE